MIDITPSGQRRFFLHRFSLLGMQMEPLNQIALKPNQTLAAAEFDSWIASIAERLLNRVDLVVNSSPYRFAELEAYYHGPGHLDLFAHCDPLQLEHGRWYFHRSQGAYRGGSFKGLDLTFGDGTAHFGILIRTIIAADGMVLDGPCVTVDHLLEQTRTGNVATLDLAIAGRKLWDTTSPLFLRESDKLRTAPVYRCSRVGLSLKKATGKPDAPRFVGSPYRFLTEPRAITKGKPHLVLSLHHRGQPPDEIAKLTGCPKKTVERYMKDFESGKTAAAFDGYIGNTLSTAELCNLLGTWAATHTG